MSRIRIDGRTPRTQGTVERVNGCEEPAGVSRMTTSEPLWKAAPNNNAPEASDMMRCLHCPDVYVDHVPECLCGDLQSQHSTTHPYFCWNPACGCASYEERGIVCKTARDKYGRRYEFRDWGD